MPDATDNRVLSQLMLLQGTLDSMPTDESISRFASRGLKSVPGVSFLNVCVRGSVAEKNDLCASCNYRWGNDEDKLDYLCKLEDGGNTKCFPIRTTDCLYGFVVFSLNDTPDAFTPYEPYLQNIVNVIAISIDNRRQKQVMEAFIKQLHEEVEYRKQMAKALLKSEEQYHSLFENMLEGFAYCEMLYDEQNRPIDFVYLDVNKSFELLTGLKDVEGKKVTEVIPGIKELSPELFEIYGRVALTGKTEKFENYFKPLAKHLSISVYSPQNGYFVAVFRDITEQKRFEEKLLTISISDELTGLYNRRGFITLSEQQIKIAERTKKDMLLFFVDLDKMKQINDTLGHQEGDKALIDLSNILKDVFRESDIIGRIGGDEFAVFALNTTNDTKDFLIKRLHDTIDSYNRPEGKNYQISLSVGMAHYDAEAPSTLNELMSQADELMYEEKRKKQG